MDRYYQHKYGGIYRYLINCINTDSKKEMIVYEHVFPYDKKNYCRNINEFNNNFKLLTHEEYIKIINSDRHTMKNMIDDMKTNNKTLF